MNENFDAARLTLLLSELRLPATHAVLAFLFLFQVLALILRPCRRCFASSGFAGRSRRRDRPFGRTRRVGLRE